MEALINSFLLVFAGEMGDKTQHLALIFACRYKKPWTILSAVFVATLLNHALASWVGEWLSLQVSAQLLQWVLAFVFFVFAVWILIPDKQSDVRPVNRWGPVWTTLVAFFVAEMGDKTQLATVALGAQYSNFAIVTAGSTAGMVAANALAVFLGRTLIDKVPMKSIRIFASFLFFSFGVGLLMA